MVKDNESALRDADPTMPDGVHGRAADNWRPLLAIADLAGAEWPERARRIAVKLSGRLEDDSFGPLLLWIDKSAPDHALHHAQEDLIRYFDQLPQTIKAALHRSDVNVCAWCASIWVKRYGAAMAARLVGDVRYIDDTCAVTMC